MFGKRFTVLTFKGIPIGIDLSWFLIAFLVYWSLASGYFPYRLPGLPPLWYAGMGVAGMLGLFLCIVLHELGHAWVAIRHGIPVAKITLFIFGGVAELKKEAKTPFVEFLIAIGGPVVSLVLASLFYLSTGIGIKSGWPPEITSVTEYLAAINTLLLLFNLIPAFPLDGGRILRSIVWAKTKDPLYATRITTGIGAGFGFFLILIGIVNCFTGQLITGVWFVILGIFLQRTALLSQTRSCVNRELKGEKVAKFMKTELDTGSPDITIRDLIEHHIYTSRHHLYPITENKRLVGYIDLKTVKSVPDEERDTTLVKSVMLEVSKEQLTSPDETALEALEKINDAPFPTLFIIDKGFLIGIVTPQDLLKLVSLKLELEGKNHLN